RLLPSVPSPGYLQSRISRCPSTTECRTARAGNHRETPSRAPNHRSARLRRLIGTRPSTCPYDWFPRVRRFFGARRATPFTDYGTAILRLSQLCSRLKEGALGREPFRNVLEINR
ncbi:hypothetical protein PENTCL1PPCAC_14482, partial [Pristionchus entomophagus]